MSGSEGKTPDTVFDADTNTSLGAAPERPAPPAARFQPGELVGGRYRVLKFLARGGMGEVYEVSDLELNEPVALKTIAAERSGEGPALERFKREILLARKITHPNVCRIFDVGFHDGMAFLTMELLRGETLAERIRREGPLPPQRALPIVRQLAAALDAAHAAAIVHRDFKSSNVILVGDRAVVTDFGVATPATTDARLTQSGAVLGSPAYMAPEQVEGRDVSAQSDLYSLGVVMFEMMTRTLPFKADTPLATAAKRLTDEAPSPRQLAPGLPSTWERAILRCLERRPERRFASGADLLAALEPAPRHRAPLWPVALAVLVVAAVAIFLATRHHTATTGRARRAIAVLPLANRSGRPEQAWIGPAMAEMLEAELAAGQKVRTVSAEAAARLLGETGAKESLPLAPERLAQVRQTLGVDDLLGGSYAAGSEGLEVDLVVQKASGEVLRETEHTSESALFDLVARLGGRLRGELRLAQTTAGEAASARATLPSTEDAARLYAEALELSKRNDLVQARATLEQALEADPEFALGHSQLAQVEHILGYDDAARREARRALELAGKLSREQRLVVQARLHAIDKEWDKAAAIYRSLMDLYPDQIDYGIGHAMALTYSGHPREAITELEQLRALPGARDDMRLDLREAAAAQALADYPRLLAAAEQARKKALAVGQRGFLAEAEYYRGDGLESSGKLDEALAAYESARRIYDELGDRGGVGYQLTAISNLHARRGEFDLAEKEQSEALAIFRELGDQVHAAYGLHNLGNIRWRRSDHAGAKRHWEEALREFRAYGDQRGIASCLADLGMVALADANFGEARGLLEQARAMFKQIGYQSGEASVLGSLAELDLRHGELAAARPAIDEALTRFRALGDTDSAVEMLALRAQLEHDQGKPDAARRTLDEMGKDSQLAQLLRARFDLDENAAREAAERFRKQRADGDEAVAREILAEALVAHGKAAAAAEALARADELSGSDRELRLRIQLTSGRLQLLRGERAAGLRTLARVRSDAHDAGILLVELEAERSLAGKDPARLEELARLAEKNGYARIAAASRSH